MIHYANTWKDQHANDPETVRTDPFRITVLSPNSVVSTWRREAIPPLSAFGVPLATVRVMSHTKLSRLTRSSELLLRGPRDTLSDLEHLLLSDLVIVDEAHNFRSVAARRTRVLRDLLRLQPRREGAAAGSVAHGHAGEQQPGRSTAGGRACSSRVPCG